MKIGSSIYYPLNKIRKKEVLTEEAINEFEIVIRKINKECSERQEVIILY